MDLMSGCDAGVLVSNMEKKYYNRSVMDGFRYTDMTDTLNQVEDKLNDNVIFVPQQFRDSIGDPSVCNTVSSKRPGRGRPVEAVGGSEHTSS